MSKDAYYFQHDANAHNDPKMLSLRVKLGWEGIGLYWTFLEILREMNGYKYPSTGDYLSTLELSLSTPQATLEAWLKQCLNTGLLVEKDGFIFSESFLNRMDEIDKRRAIFREAGRRGGRNKATLKPPLSHPQATLKPPSSSKVKESKEKKRQTDRLDNGGYGGNDNVFSNEQKSGLSSFSPEKGKAKDADCMAYLKLHSCSGFDSVAVSCAKTEWCSRMEEKALCNYPDQCDTFLSKFFGELKSPKEGMRSPKLYIVSAIKNNFLENIDEINRKCKITGR